MFPRKTKKSIKFKIISKEAYHDSKALYKIEVAIPAKRRPNISI